MDKTTSSNKLRHNWPELIERCKQSGLSRRQFCKDNDLSLSKFNYYRGKFKQQGASTPKSALVPITIKANPSANNIPAVGSAFQITFKNGLYCQIPINVEAEKLKQLMEALQAC